MSSGKEARFPHHTANELHKHIGVALETNLEIGVICRCVMGVICAGVSGAAYCAASSVLNFPVVVPKCTQYDQNHDTKIPKGVRLPGIESEI
jgi:hypothetical protein